MKRIVISLASLGSLFFVASSTVYAKSICPGGQFNSLCNLKPSQSGNILGAVVQLLLIAAAIISLFFLIWGGIKYTTSGGDKGNVTQARQTIIAAIIGLAISLLAYFILNVVLFFLTGKGLGGLSIPTL